MKQAQSDTTAGENIPKSPVKLSVVLPHKNSNVRKIIAVAGEKGGVGCSLVTALLAVCMQRRGFHTAILDGNRERPSIAWSLGATQTLQREGDAWIPLRTAVGIDIISINLFPCAEKPDTPRPTPLRLFGDILWKDVDFLFVNLPGLGQQDDLSNFKITYFDGLLAVTTPEQAGAKAVLGASRAAQVPVLGIVENFSSAPMRRSRAIKSVEMSHNAANQDMPPLLARIPPLKRLASGQEEGMVETFEGNWLDKTADIVEMLLDQQ